MKAENTGLIILAAGGSQRLGRPKQLLPYEGISLLKHAIQVGMDSKAHEILVVLGAHANEIIKEVVGDRIQVAVNADWQEGIASSIRFGLQALLKAQPEITGVVIMLCDQPYVTAPIINNLIELGQSTDKLIIASTYGSATGVPAWFHRDVFPDLLHLRGDMGAKAVIKEHITKVATIPFQDGNIDIDTETDYTALISHAAPLPYPEGAAAEQLMRIPKTPIGV